MAQTRGEFRENFDRVFFETAFSDLALHQICPNHATAITQGLKCSQKYPLQLRLE